MNAYELADELEKVLGVAGLKDNRVPAMLRQQADRIAELESKLEKIRSRKDLLNFILDRKPLSDEEIKELIVNKVTDYELCRAIEERHGIK